MSNVFVKQPRATRLTLHAIYVRDNLKSFVCLVIGCIAAFLFLAGFGLVVAILALCFIGALLCTPMLESPWEWLMTLVGRVQKTPLYLWMRSPEGRVVVTVIVFAISMISIVVWRFYRHTHYHIR